MQIKTFSELIEWIRSLHENLATCLTHCATLHSDERASLLLEYVAARETEMEKMVSTFKRQADPKAAQTYVYDSLPHNLITAHLVCDNLYASLDADAITAEVFDFYEQIADLYSTLLGNAVISEAAALMRALIDMEENETKRLARHIGRMDDL